MFLKQKTPEFDLDDLCSSAPGMEIESKYYNSPVLLPVAKTSLELSVPVVPLFSYQSEMNECQVRVEWVGCSKGVCWRLCVLGLLGIARVFIIEMFWLILLRK